MREIIISREKVISRHDNLFSIIKVMDAEYLQRTVGRSLAIGLAEVSSVRPADPIEYLALWLLKRKENLRNRGPSIGVSFSTGQYLLMNTACS